jgi:NAD(P) transhydrogenase subunit beta
MWRSVIGANDVVNPAARLDKNSPIFGMPIIDADKAKVVLGHQEIDESWFCGNRKRSVFR